MRMEVSKCDGCGRFWSRPTCTPELPCLYCRPREHYAAVGKIIEERAPNGRIELAVFGSPIDRLQEQITMVDDVGNFYKFALRYPMGIADRMQKRHEELVAELQKLRDENREVLAENARFRRQLEKK